MFDLILVVYLESLILLNYGVVVGVGTGVGTEDWFVGFGFVWTNVSLLSLMSF